MCHGKYCAEKIQNTCAFKMQRYRLFNPFSLHTCTQCIAVEKGQKGALRTILSYSTQPSKHGRDQLQQLYSHGHLSIYNHVRPGLSWNSVVKGNTITASAAPTALVIGCRIAHRGARGEVQGCDLGPYINYTVSTFLFTDGCLQLVQGEKYFWTNIFPVQTFQLLLARLSITVVITCFDRRYDSSFSAYSSCM